MGNRRDKGWEAFVIISILSLILGIWIGSI
jgi:hypothetical protein